MSTQNYTTLDNDPRLFSWAVWHSCRMGARNQEQTRGRIGPQLRLGNLRVGELHFCPLCTALDQASSLSRKLAYVPGPTFGFVKPLASSGSHCTKWADEQHWQAGFESRLLPDLPLPFIPTLIGLRAFDLVSSRVWWEAATNTMVEIAWAKDRGQFFYHLDPHNNKKITRRLGKIKFRNNKQCAIIFNKTSLNNNLLLLQYIYIYSHPQTDCFVPSELFSVARHTGRSKPGSKPVQLYVRLWFRPLVHQADYVG